MALNHWWEVTISTPVTVAGSEHEELLVWYLSELGSRGSAAQSYPDRFELRGYLSADTTQAVFEDLRVRVGQQIHESRVSWQLLAETDWDSAWKAHWQPREVGERLLICPAWLSPPPGDRLVIRMDPGVAFGTGEHATTRLCLEALERLSGLSSFADVGCGSGILTVAALRLGATSGWAVDTDPLAVGATTQNLLLNGLDGRVEVHLGSTNVSGPVAGVISNILAPVIIELAPEYARLVHSGGWGVFSGLLQGQKDAVAAALGAQGWQWQQTLAEEEWVCLVGVFGSAPS